MLILTIRTDKPEAEVGLFDDRQQLSYKVWHAHRALAETLLQTIADQLESQGKQWRDIEGVVCFEGPGSFTGLRIGLAVANTLAYSLAVPVIAARDPEWLQQGLARCVQGQGTQLALPYYGAEVHITPAKK